MTAINHALTGTAIGLLIGEPVVALPAAVLSHYICDAIPHFRSPRFKGTGEIFLRSRWFRNYLIAEAVLCVLLVAGLAIMQPLHWQLAAVCAFLAAAPDLLSYNRFQTAKERKKYRPGLYVRFACAIQWFERPIGGVVEVAWFVAALIVIAPFIKSL